MRFPTLNEWLDWQLTLHWQKIELGLNRIQQVANRLGLNTIAKHTIIVAGTNGKGSTVAYYAQFLQAAGYSVGCYTSPHLMRYNERISINSQAASDDQIMQAFHQIDEARGDISLSYFEFGTLAALLCIQQAEIDVAILEVGLGGRLDAVNIIDADLVHFTPIGIDHTAWLGDTRELIGFEKAGVLRKQCQVVCNDLNPPLSLVKQIKKQSDSVVYINDQYSFNAQSNKFYCDDVEINLENLALVGEHQKLNCSGVLAGLMLLNQGLYFKQDVFQNALKHMSLKGRFETVTKNETRKIIVDVGHNDDAADVLVKQLMLEAPKHCVMILGMLADKNATNFTDKLAEIVDHCICIGLEGDRALSADELSVKINTEKMSKEISLNMADALSKAETYLSHSNSKKDTFNHQDIIIVTGSFHTVEAYFSSI